MSDTLYRCQCCNKLVPASHFKRVWSVEDMAEVLNSPQFKGVLRAAVQEEIKRLQPVVEQRERFRVKVAPVGWWTYEQAADAMRARYPHAAYIKAMSIRGLVCQKLVNGGKGFVEAASMLAYLERYKPRPNHHMRKALITTP